MKTPLLAPQVRLLQTIFVVISGLLALTAPLPLMAQQTVFYDTFGSSTLNGQSGSMLPGGTPTASWTSYEIGSAKSATGTTNFAGHFQIITAGTSSGNTEAEALFTQYPVTLASIGDYIELDYTFTDVTNILNGLGGNNTGLYCGLFNSGGVPPLSGTLLWNSGFSSSLYNADTGGTADWVGYNAAMLYGQTAIYKWAISSRPVQTAANNDNQQLLYGATGGSSQSATPPGTAPFPTDVIVGSQYTVQFRITLSAAATLTVSNAMWVGTGIGGAMVFSNMATYTGANVLTTNFDGLGVGYRAGDSLSPHLSWTNDINSITVIASLAAQAGPYYFVTGSGHGCGSETIGLSGSVATNVYLLYTNGVFNGDAVAGDGLAISFGLQTAPAVYTVIASNTVTGSMGPMLGSTVISQGPAVITSEPVSVTLVTNAPASFTVASTGNELTYQWYKNGVALTNGGDVSGATTTNLIISPARAADAAAATNGYYVVITTTCGDMTTSAPNASLTLVAPNNLVWQGGNPNDNWDVTTTPNFTNAITGVDEEFTNGDIVTFNDTSGNTSVTITNSVIPTLVTVSGSQYYTFLGSGAITGFGQLVDVDAGTVTIDNSDTYTGGTIVSNGATLSLGDGTSASGSITGNVVISSNSVLQYYYNNDAPIGNKVSGNGTVLYNLSSGNHTYTIPVSNVNSNFTGTNIIEAGVALHCSDLNAGYLLGNGSVVIVNNYGQVWCDRSTTNYNQTFILNGDGWNGASTPLGALRLYDCTVSGPVILTADSRIGGTIDASTITGQISGNYQLEVLGNTNSFILILGPTNGPNTYGDTLVTSGAIRALTFGGISTNALYDDLLGEVDVYGNNVSVNSLNDGPNGAGVVYNMSAATNGTLTVGADGTSTEFDGVFGDGASKSLNLTKVGLGTLTLTGVNTNTGTVAVNGGTLALSGSGSFGNAAVIAPASGATYDVSNAGGTLTLNSGQTLTGSGTVNGNVSASAGSTINPGDTIGALNVSGNLTLAGAVLMELNRTNTPATNDSIVVSGLITGGGTLTVTNLGPALHNGDTFKLFSAGVSGFTSTNLPTIDLANNVEYTWNNTISSNGKITVASVTPLVNTNPPKLQVSVTGNTLSLAWPTNAGWTLLTNSVGLAATNQWYPYPNSANLTNVSITLNPGKTNVFFRMVYP
jgi:autotransporter-associated beta strand protein